MKIEKLYEFVKKGYFNKLGVFTYSKEDGTPAEKLKEQIHPQTKKSRYNKIMKLENEISRKKLEEHIGKKYKVLIETKTFDGKYYIGRTYMDIPDMDGVVFIKNTIPNLEETWVKVKIEDVRDYDLVGRIEE